MDTYGGIGRHGGGAFLRQGPDQGGPLRCVCGPLGCEEHRSGRSAKRCEIQLAYAIGVAEPVSIMVETFGTGVVGDDVLEKAVEKVFDLRPAAIIEQFDLRKPIYKQLEPTATWAARSLASSGENTDKVGAALKAAVQA